VNNGSIKLANIFGIRIGVNASWFVVLGLFILILSSEFQQTVNASETVSYLTAVFAVFLFFLSVVLHELGHALVARRNGIGISGIDLWFFGGVAKMERDTDSPGVEFRVSAAGPAVTLLIVAICVPIVVAIYGSQVLFDIAFLKEGVSASPAAVLVSWLAMINTVLFAFNMIPAFPLDGGRIARAVVWKITGDRFKATKVAATVGQGFGYLLMALGVSFIFTSGISSGLWWLVLGFFLNQSARSATLQNAVSQKVAAISVDDVMERDPFTVPEDTTVDRAQEEYFFRYRWPWFPVVDRSHRIVGLIDEHQVRDASQQAALVKDLMIPVDKEWLIKASEPVENAFGSERLRSFGTLLAVDSDGVLKGLLTTKHIRRVFESIANIKPTE